MTLFTPDTPLSQEVQALLLENPAGLTLPQIRRLLRHKGRHVSEDNLRELLGHARTFSLLSGERYVLAGHERAGTGAPPSLPKPRAQTAADVWYEPLIGNLPLARRDYVVFDLETTGTDPEHDHILQIAALLVRNDAPVAVRNWYVNPGGVEIPYTLQIVLGMDKEPGIERAIAAAPDLAAVLPQFLAFAGDLPLVAHNARFDARFISTACPDLALQTRVIDSLELAHLLAPNLHMYRLAALAEALGLDIDQLGREWQGLSLASNFGEHTVSAVTLHNALTDVFVLYRVYSRLLDSLEQPGPRHRLLEGLLPEAFGGAPQVTDLGTDILTEQRHLCDWQMRPPAPSTLDTVPSGAEILTTYLAATGRQPRAGQLEMQQRIEQASANGQFTMIEAPTGTGKTLAYLTAAVHHALTSGERVAVSTAYRNLQDQLLAEIGDLQQRGPVAFRSQLLKGAGNYLCWSQIGRYLEEGCKDDHPLTLAERFVLAYIALWLPGSDNGTVDELSFWLLETLPVARHVIGQLRAGPACSPNLQEACQCCPMPTAYANAQSAEIVVLNHALWLTDSPRLPPFAHIVLDEAHTLEDVATSALTEEVSSETLGDLLRRLYDPRTERGLLPRIRSGTHHPAALKAAAGAINAARRVLTFVEDFGPYLVQFIRRSVGQIDPRYGASYRLEAPPWKVHGPRWQRVNDAHKQLFGLHLPNLLEALAALRQAVAEAGDLAYRAATMRDVGDLLARLTEQRKLAYGLLKVDDLKMVYWVAVGPPTETTIEADRDTRPEWWALRAAPIDVGEALAPFYDALSSASFVSATLALRGNDFSYFLDRLGLGERVADDRLRKLPPALPYQSNVLLGLVDFLTYAPLSNTMASFKEELAKELSLFLRFTDGRALGLFTSRERMEAVAEKITVELAQHGIPLYLQSPNTSRVRLLEAFKERNEAVLFGLRSFWEGVDAPGETLSFVLMEKLPFPLLTEPIHRARAEHLARRGKSEFDDYMLPLMLLQFKQGFGRLLRRDDDRGAVILYDRRIHRKEYKADLLASLPGFLPRNEDAERSRRLFYETIANAFPGLIDLAAKQDLLEGLPDTVLLNLEAVLESYQIPAAISPAEYEQWRPVLLAALKELFGHDAFRLANGMPAQEQVIQHLLAGEDVLGVLPTGAGKSLTFQLPALLRAGVTLVFSPLIALMRDQVAGLNEKGIEVVGAIYSGQSASERDDVLERMQRGRARLVYVAPERLRDPQLLSALQQTHVVQVVVDEAHCVYMWGPSFRPDFLYLPRIFDLLGYRPPVAALTATATPAMQEAITQALNLRSPARVIAPIDRPELQFVVLNSRSRYGTIRSRNDRFKRLLAILEAADRDRPPMLVYVATTVEADQLARQLRIAGYDARAYHGKMEPADRASVQEMFMDEHINIVVCTKAFGMGIDKPNIRYVIHYNMPGDLESYFQEAGRAGRDGQSAYCILLYHESDIGTQEFFIANSTPDADTINHVLRYLAAQPGDVLYLDPDECQERLGLEDVQLRVALHHLEAQDFLVRQADFTLTAGLTFQVAPEEAVAAWQATGDPRANLLQRAVRLACWPAYRKLEVELSLLAWELGVRPDELDSVLQQLSARREAIFRPWRRGLTLRKQPAMNRAGPVSAGALAAEQHRDDLRRKLAEIVAYASGNRACRRATIVRYFGQNSDLECAGCDVCQPERQWPWSEITEREFATPDAYVDPAFVVLETVKWNLDRAARYGAPYSIGTLKALLKADQYSATRFIEEPHLRQWRLQQLRGCPHWGILSVLPARDRVLDATIARLVDEGYMELTHQEWEGGSSYAALTLTSKGISQLTSGRLLQWEMN